MCFKDQRHLSLSGVLPMKIVAFFIAFVFATPLFALEKEACLDCHGTPDILSMSEQERLDMVIPTEEGEEWPEGFSDLYIDPDLFSRSAHRMMECTDCHSDIKELPHPQRLGRADCTRCHGDEMYDDSGHPALCYQCHNPHYDRSAFEIPAEEWSRRCGACHEPGELAEGNYLHQKHIPLGKVSCAVCHTLRSRSGVLLVLEVQGEVRRGEMDPNGDGTVDYGELRGLMAALREKGRNPRLRAEMGVFDSLHYYGVEESWKDCLRCHSPKGLYRHGALLVVSPDSGRPIVSKADPRIVTTVADFYPVGSDPFSYGDLRDLFGEKEEGRFNLVVSRIGWKWLDILGYIFLLGAVAFVAIHGALRLLTLRWRHHRH